MLRSWFSCTFAMVLSLWASCSIGQANKANLAQGFESLPKGATIVLVGPDVGMYSGRGAYRADWTDMARGAVRAALLARAATLGISLQELPEARKKDFAELSALHGVVGRSIVMHQHGPDALPTKAEMLDWSLGDAVTPLREASGADYALFMWVRSSRMESGDRVAGFGLFLLTGVTMVNIQIGHASLVDLRSGRLLWFDHQQRGARDLSKNAAAAETVNSLMKFFPNRK